jgi:hypothetical protein
MLDVIILKENKFWTEVHIYFIINNHGLKSVVIQRTEG